MEYILPIAKVVNLHKDFLQVTKLSYGSDTGIVLKDRVNKRKSTKFKAEFHEIRGVNRVLKYNY